MLRTLVRDKATLVAEAGDWVRRMQKSLDQMNVRVHRAVSDISGTTGMAIIRAIAEGERDAGTLAHLRDPHCRKSEEEIAEQLTGHWREDHLFSLCQALKMYEAIEERISAYEQEILRKLAEMEQEGQGGNNAPALNNINKARMIKKRGQEPKRQALYRMSGVDATQIDAIGVETVEVILSEYGPDLSRFPSEEQFVSHATLAPHTEERRQAGQKEKAEQHEHPCRNRFAHGGAVITAQRHRSGGVLSEYREKKRPRHCNLCRSQKNSHFHLSPASLGTTLHRRGRRGVRKATSAAAPQRAGVPSPTTRLSIGPANSLIPLHHRQ